MKLAPKVALLRPLGVIKDLKPFQEAEGTVPLRQ